MARLLFLNPPSLTAENVVRDSIYGCWCKGKRIGGAMTPPYPQLLLATLMGREGHEVELIDALAEDTRLKDIREKVRDFDFVIVLTSVMTFNEDKIILKSLKDVNSRLKTIIYGSLPTFLPEFCLKGGAVDFLIRREAEYALRDFLNRYTLGDGSWKAVKGIGFKDNGTIRVNDFYPFIENLDELPFADWHLLKGRNRYFNPSIKRFPFVTDLTTRGCPGKCIYCMAPGFYGRKVRKRSARNVLEGFRRHLAEGVREVYLRDENFTTFRKRNLEIYNTMISEGMDLSWLCSSKIGMFSREDLELMKASGCHTLKMGVETGSQQILNNIKKGITIEQTRSAFALARQAGIRTHAHLMLGHPGETEATIRQTIRFVKELDPTTVTFGIMTPFPGTELFNIVIEKHPELSDAYNLRLEDLHTRAYFSDAYCEVPSEELARWMKRAHRAFYFRPGYIVKSFKEIDSMRGLLSNIKAGFKVATFSILGD